MGTGSKEKFVDKRKARHSNDANRPNKESVQMRSAATVRRLKMYKTRPVRNRKGKILRNELQSKELPNTRIMPDRRWFGNVRVIGQKQLERFREEMRVKVDDTFTVLLREKKLPLQLLKEPEAGGGGARKGDGLLQVESFGDVFGPSKKRKRLKISLDSYEDLLNSVDEKGKNYLNKLEKGGDRDLVSLDDRHRESGRDSLFEKGQSKRIWGELYKVVDSSDVIIQVLDARDPNGTRSYHLEKNIRKNHPHKHLLLLLNKCDLVPAWVTKRWLHTLSREYPTLAFHANMKKPFGKGSVLSVLRQLSRLRSDKKSISVGFVGYPNVGKSSVINTLKMKKVCNVAPVPGETKVWQYITLIKRINLIDCPGVVHHTTDNSKTATVLKGVVRIEQLEDATEYIPPLLERVKRQYLTRAYQIKEWTDYEDFLTQLAKKSGKLLKGGDPDLNIAARMVLLDWQRGRIPFFSLPPDYVDKLPKSVEEVVESEDDWEGDGDEPKQRSEVKLAKKAQDAVKEMSMRFAENYVSGMPLKKHYFTPEDAYENGVGPQERDRESDSADLEDPGESDSGDLGDPEDLGESDSGDPEDLGESDSGDPEDLGESDSGDPEDLGESDSGDPEDPEDRGESDSGDLEDLEDLEEGGCGGGGGGEVNGVVNEDNGLNEGSDDDLVECDVSDSDSDGYGVEGLSWEAVLESLKEGDEEDGNRKSKKSKKE